MSRNVLLILTLFICNVSAQEVTGPAGAVTSGSIPVGEKSVILYGNLGKELLNPCSRPGPKDIDGYWTPSIKEIKQLEKSLPLFIKKQLNKIIISSWQNYYRQYTGFTRRGRKHIYVSFNHPVFVEDMGASWKVEALIFCDGGEAFFGLEYDVKAKEFSELEINAIA